jgi:hypothetical protein
MVCFKPAMICYIVVSCLLGRHCDHRFLKR